jgi:hypothetical protein
VLRRNFNQKSCKKRLLKIDRDRSQEYPLHMTVEKIRKRFAGGFRPFVLRTSDGRQYEIPHPEFIAIGKRDLAVVDKDGDIDILEPLHIVSLKLTKSTNGTSRRN